MTARIPMYLTLITLIGCHPQHSKPTGKEMTKSAAATNPFLAEWDTPFGAPPFERIENAHYLPTFEKAIDLQRAEIAAIVDNPEDPTFENTVAAFERSGALRTKTGHVFFGLLGARTDDEMQSIAEKVEPLIARHKDDIYMNETLFERFNAVYQKRADLGLDAEQTTLLEEYYQDFVRGGAQLDASGKAQLRKINEELSLLTLDFSTNVLKEQNRFAMVLDKKEDLEGLPESAIAAAAEAAAERDQNGKWAFTLHKPSLIPFLTYSAKRDLREKMFTAYVNMGNHDDDLDNKKNLSRIVELRIAKAKLMGYETYADFALSRRMAKEPKRAYGLVKKLWKPALRVAKKEVKALQKIVKKEGSKFEIEPWDWWYYAEKVRKDKYDLDDSELRPYFKLENVRDGAFAVATKLYGLQFIEKKDVPTYHEDVRVFEVQEKDGTHVGIFYVDYFPRASKRSGAWCGAYRDQSTVDGKRIAPIITNVGNFSMPTGDKPALLSLSEVETLFHEFGHALNFLLGDTTYRRSQDYVKVDFVELASQIMENWAIEGDVLREYARHYETNEPMPDQLIEKIENSQLFNQGFATVEYLAASFLDLDWHTLRELPEGGVTAFESKALKKIKLIPEIVTRYRSTYFKHAFGGDHYAAGYYSYIWAEVLEADAFEVFKKKGLFDQASAQSFRDNILSRGGSEDPKVLYKRFRGTGAKIDPLLKRRGLR